MSPLKVLVRWELLLFVICGERKWKEACCFIIALTVHLHVLFSYQTSLMNPRHSVTFVTAVYLCLCATLSLSCAILCTVFFGNLPRVVSQHTFLHMSNSEFRILLQNYIVPLQRISITRVKSSYTAILHRHSVYISINYIIYIINIS